LLCTALAGLIVVLAGALLAVTMQMHDNLGWLDHSSRVLRTANHALSSLRTAESGQRGFTLTRDPDFARAVGPALDTARRDAADLVNLTADKPEQNERARQLQALVAGRADTLEAAARLARSGQFDQARQSTASRHGLELMQLVEAKVNDLLLDERALAADRMAAVESLLRTIRWLVILGTPLTLLMLALVARSLIQRIRRPAGEMLAVMGELGAGHREARITGEMGSREFAQLASGYNAMADELQRAVANQAEAAESLKTANAALSRNADTLRERGEVIEILGAWPTACRPPAPTRNWPQSSRSSCRACCRRFRRAVRAQQFAQSLGAHGYLGWAGASADGFRAGGMLGCAVARAISWMRPVPTSSARMWASGPITTIASRCWPAAK
jgi:CHASE3 domain sensor protein